MAPSSTTEIKSHRTLAQPETYEKKKSQEGHCNQMVLARICVSVCFLY